MSLPLSPFTLLEVAGPEAQDMHHLALALAGRIAADLGATVIRAAPADDDPLLRTPVLPWEADGAAEAVAATLDASKIVTPIPPGAEGVLDELAAVADGVFTCGAFLPDPERRRVSVRLETLPSNHPFNPGDGPPVGELGLLALSGLLDIVGDPEREPIALGGHQAAYAGGLACFAAMMTGLAGRVAHGVGDAYDVDMLDVLAWVNWKAVGAAEFRPQDKVTREGRQAEWQVLRAADGWIALVFNERDWPQLAKLVGHPALADPALATSAGRGPRRAAYMPHIEAWVAARTREEIYRDAQARRVPIGPVVEPGEIVDDVQAKARRMIAEVKRGPTGRAMSAPLSPVVWNGAGFPPRPTATMAPEAWLAARAAAR
ncbi:MAG: CoA transferase [Alphaproteobacteria bacterium]